MSESRFEMLVGLEVLDEERYAEYRAAMKPILHRMGGRFTCDFRVSGVLTEDVTGAAGEEAIDPRINRVFVLSFPDEQTKEAFFGDAGYVEAREEWFEGAVGVVRVLFER